MNYIEIGACLAFGFFVVWFLINIFIGVIIAFISHLLGK